MELRHLRYFVATAEELHFTRAAQRLGIAQPPLTQQIKALEAELGLTLFHRLPGRVELTDAGQVFFEDAQRILDSVGRAVARSQSSAKGMVGRLGIGFTESASFSTLVMSALRRYRRDFPNVELSFEEARTAQLIELLRQGRIDVAFVRPPVARGDDLTFRPLYSERMVVAVPRNDRLAERRSLRLVELRAEEFILYPRATRLGLSDVTILTACEKGRVQSADRPARPSDIFHDQFCRRFPRHHDRSRMHDEEPVRCRELRPSEFASSLTPISAWPTAAMKARRLSRGSSTE